MATEKGIYVLPIGKNFKLDNPTYEVYLEDQLVSQIYEFAPHTLIASQFDSAEYAIIRT